MKANEVMFSLTEFVKEIYDKKLYDTYNAEGLGKIDDSNIALIHDNEFLWDMTAEDIDQCRDVENNGFFTLRGENLLKRFGDDALSMLDASYDEIDKFRYSNYDMDADNCANLIKLINLIFDAISNERLSRSNISAFNRKRAVVDLIEYAQTGKILFMMDINIKEEKDDRGRLISKDLRSKDNRIICKSKRCCNCGNPLSKLAGKYEEKIISFIGSPTSGKTAYLSAAVHKLMTIGHSEYGIDVVYDYQSGDYINFNKTCLEPYSKGFDVLKTDEGKFPQLSIALTNPKLKNPDGSIGKTYLYTFVDIPGETFINKDGIDESDLSTNRKIIKYADVIWYCVST